MLNYVTEVYNRNKVYEINDSGTLTEKSENDNVEYSAYLSSTTSLTLVVCFNIVVVRCSNGDCYVA